MFCDTHSSPAEALHVVRLQGAFGPVLRCMGPLTVATAEALRREVGLLLPLSGRALILNLTDCRSLDAEGVLLLLDIYRRTRDSGKQLLIVTRREPVAGRLRLLGIDTLLPVFPTEAAALRALSGGEADASTTTWETARQSTLVQWERALQCIETGELARAAGELLTPLALCRRAEELTFLRRDAGTSPCRHCPLFRALGGREEDLDCRSVREPLTEALQRGDTGRAALLTQGMVETLRHLDVSGL